MRHDMFNVIVERPRSGSKSRFGEVRNNKKIQEFLEETSISKIGTRKLITYAVGWDRKNLNENLNPLTRFLWSKVGQPWDNVYSEICEHIDSNSTVQKHVLDHLNQYVEIDYRYQSGMRYGIGRRYYWGERTPDYYVDTDGILRTNLLSHNGKNRTPYVSWKDREAEKLHERFRKLNNEEIWKIEGIWYRPLWKLNENKFLRSDGTFALSYATDFMTGDKVPYGSYYRYDKRQVDSKTLKRFKVLNDTP